LSKNDTEIAHQKTLIGSLSEESRLNNKKYKELIPAFAQLKDENIVISTDLKQKIGEIARQNDSITLLTENLKSSDDKCQESREACEYLYKENNEKRHRFVKSSVERKQLPE